LTQEDIDCNVQLRDDIITDPENPTPENILRTICVIMAREIDLATILFEQAVQVITA
jgi:hypothetical protein